MTVCGSVNPTTLDPILVIENLTIRYNKSLASDHNLAVNPGEILSLVGPSSGVGKTTLLRTIVGLVEPISKAVHCNVERRDIIGVVH